jgi:hypothetical protein
MMSFARPLREPGTRWRRFQAREDLEDLIDELLEASAAERMSNPRDTATILTYLHKSGTRPRPSPTADCAMFTFKV